VQVQDIPAAYSIWLCVRQIVLVELAFVQLVVVQPVAVKLLVAQFVIVGLAAVKSAPV